jgi:hypothetical protein
MRQHPQTQEVPVTAVSPIAAIHQHSVHLTSLVLGISGVSSAAHHKLDESLAEQNATRLRAALLY